MFKVVSLGSWQDFVATVTRSDASSPSRVLRNAFQKKAFIVRTGGVLQRVKDKHRIWRTPEGQAQYTPEQKQYHSKAQPTSVCAGQFITLYARRSISRATTFD